MSGPFKNPYNPTGKLWKNLHKVSGQVSHDDFLFFKNLFPSDGSVDALVSNLFKNLVDELRDHHTQSPIERAWYVDSQSYGVLAGILQRRSNRQSAGHSSTRDDTTTVVGVHQEMCDSEKLSPNTQERPAKRRKTKGQKRKTKKQN